MTASQMFERAVTLCGYTDNQGNISGEQRLRSRAVAVINTIYSDLHYAVYGEKEKLHPIDGLDCEIRLPERVLNDIMPYGVAQLIAQNESDGDTQQMFVMLYNQKRASISKTDSVVDVIPFPC